MTFLLIVTVASMLLAAMMSIVAWRLARDEGRRSDARVAALSAEIHATEPSTGRAFSDPSVGRALSDPPQSRVRKDPAYSSHDPAYRGDLSDPELTYSTLFTAPKPRSGARPLATLLVGILTVGAVAAMAVVLPRILTRAARVAPPAAALPSPLPLELVALGHERVGDQLTVRGVVRNPSTGTAIDRLTAVVFVVAPDGEYLATGRSAVEAPALQPGREATFAVTVPGAGDVSRYRVSFRAGDRLVPHLDRRHEG
ncbi:MAG TPA: hypothetical protein VGP77_14850 [Vicinamibacterales bacterium]|nr:hypothetical protein [Vicinamibacterales bacterium]